VKLLLVAQCLSTAKFGEDILNHGRAIIARSSVALVLTLNFDLDLSIKLTLPYFCDAEDL